MAQFLRPRLEALLANPEDGCLGDLQLPLRQKLGSGGSCVIVLKDPTHSLDPSPALSPQGFPAC